MNYPMLFIAGMEKGKIKKSLYPKHLRAWNRIFADLKETFKDAGEDSYITISEAEELADELIARLEKEEYEFFAPYVDTEKLKDEKIMEVAIGQPLGALLGVSLKLSTLIMQANWTDRELTLEELAPIDIIFHDLVRNAEMGLYDSSELN